MLLGVAAGMPLWVSSQARVCFTVLTLQPAEKPCGPMPPCFSFAATAASSWKVRASSRTRSPCAPPTTPTRWPVRGCLRWRRTAGAARPSRSNPEPHIQVRIDCQRSLAGDQRMMHVQIFKAGEAKQLQAWRRISRVKKTEILIAPMKVIGIFASHEKTLLYSFL